MSQTLVTGERAGLRRPRRALKLIFILSVAGALSLLAAPLAANAATPASAPKVPAVSCNQNSYVVLLTPDGNLYTPPNSSGSVSDPVYFNLDFAGVVAPGSSVTLVFTNVFDPSQVVNIPSNNWAGDNCVLNQEPNVFNGTRIGVGTWSVQAYFSPWELQNKNNRIYEPMGTLTLS